MTNPPELGEWRRTSPFAIVFFFVSTIRSIVGNGINLITSFGLIAFLSRLDSLAQGFSLPLAILLGLTGIGGVALLRYWFFRFRLEEDRILIRQGLVRRTALDLPFDRVQAINVERSLVDRILGLVTVRIDTAGSSTAEGHLPTISVALANWLQERVERGRPAHTSTSSATEESPTSAPRPESDPPAETLLRLGSGELVRLGLADYRIFLVLGALSGVTAESWASRVVEGVESALAGYGAQVLVLASIALLFLLALLFTAAALASAFLRYHGFILWRKGTALHSRGGLLTQKEVVVEVARIQQLSLSQNLVMRAFGRVRLAVFPAGATGAAEAQARSQSGAAENLTVPLLEAPRTESLRREIFGNEAPDLSLLPTDRRFVRISPWYIRALALRMALIPLLFAGLIIVAGTAIEVILWTIGSIFFGQTPPPELMAAPALFAVFSSLLPWYLAWILLALLIPWQIWRRRALLRTDQALAIRRGLLGYRVDAFLMRKVQSVAIRQSPLQRRRGLANLEIQLASGKVAVPCLAYGTAREIFDYILGMVESDPQRWY